MSVCLFLWAWMPGLLAAGGETRPLDACIPEDAMVAWFVRPTPEMLSAPPGGTAEQLASWLITLKAMGVIPDEGKVIADIVGTLPILARHPHALALLDVTSKPIGAGRYRLNDMQAALIVDGTGLSVDIDRRIRDLLATYTDPDDGTVQVIHIGNARYYQLVDRRLPAWATIAWGEVGQQFVLTFGQDTFLKMLDVLAGRSPRLSDDSWFQRAHRRCRGATSGIEGYVNALAIRARVGEVVEGRPAAVAGALGIQEADRLLWTVGFDGRALRSEIIARATSGKDHYAMLTGPQVTAPAVSAAIPPDASKYAAFHFPLSDAVRSGLNAYLQSRSVHSQQRLNEGWSKLEDEFGFDTDQELVEQLGQYFVVHDYPRHRLNLPVLVTIWLQLRADREKVAVSLDRLMSACQRYLENPSETRPAISLTPRLHREPDGIWYMQLGLIAPAVGVGNGWIVISYSPQAVRANLAHLGNLRPATATAPSTDGHEIDDQIQQPASR